MFQSTILLQINPDNGKDHHYSSGTSQIEIRKKKKKKRKKYAEEVARKEKAKGLTGLEVPQMLILRKPLARTSVTT